MKIDLSDAFMRVPLQLSHVLALSVLLPKEEEEPQLVGFPLVLPMGWVESPTYFCTVSKTITNLANATIRQGLVERPHRLEKEANSRPAQI